MLSMIYIVLHCIGHSGLLPLTDPELACLLCVLDAGGESVVDYGELILYVEDDTAAVRREYILPERKEAPAVLPVITLLLFFVSCEACFCMWRGLLLT